MIQHERCKYVRHLRTATPDAVNEELYDLVCDPDELHNVISDGHYRDAFEWCRRRYDWVMDTTPPAQTQWVPLMASTH